MFVVCFKKKLFTLTLGQRQQMTFKVPKQFLFHNDLHDRLVDEDWEETLEVAETVDVEFRKTYNKMFELFNGISADTILQHTRREDWKGYSIYSKKFRYANQDYDNHSGLDVWSLLEVGVTPLEPLYVYRCKCIVPNEGMSSINRFIRQVLDWQKQNDVDPADTSVTEVTVCMDDKCNATPDESGDRELARAIMFGVKTSIWNAITSDKNQRLVLTLQTSDHTSEVEVCQVYFDYVRLLIELLGCNNIEEVKTQLLHVYVFDWPYVQTNVTQLLRDVLPKTLKVPWFVVKLVEEFELRCVGLQGHHDGVLDMYEHIYDKVKYETRPIRTFAREWEPFLKRNLDREVAHFTALAGYLRQIQGIDSSDEPDVKLFSL